MQDDVMAQMKKKVFGYHAVMSAISVLPEKIGVIYLQNRKNKRFLQVTELAHKHQISIRYILHKDLDKMVSTTNHQGIAAEVIYPEKHTEDDLQLLLKKRQNKLFLLILDGVQDPHNLGACLRTANAAGVDAVVAPKDKACGLAPSVHKVASGAVGLTPFIQVTNLARTIRMLKENNVWIYGTSDDADASIYETNLTTPLALVLGAEGKGIRRLIRDNCDFMVKIPMRGIVRNLNVAVAAGVCLFEVMRQQILP